MLLAVLSLVIVIPALVVVWAGERLVAIAPPENATRNWTLFLVLSATGILLYFSSNAQSFADGDFPWLVLILLPTLEGLLALIIVRWRDFMRIWKEEKLLLSGLLLALLALLASLGRHSGAILAPIGIALLAVVTALIWEASRRSSLKALEVAAVLVAALLFLDAAGLISGPTVMGIEWFRVGYWFARNTGIILALILAAILILRSLNGREAKAESRSPPTFTLVAILLIALASEEVRNGVLVEATGRAAEDHLPFIEMLIATIAGMVMIGISDGRRRLAGIVYTILVPAMLIGAYTVGWMLDPQEITQRRAERIAEAVERYKMDNDIYPVSLELLTPQYIPYILGPLTGRGQMWCYQGDLDFYRLGYVFFQRYYRPTFPDPYYEIRITHSAGRLPQDSWMCDDELVKFKQTGGL